MCPLCGVVCYAGLSQPVYYQDSVASLSAGLGLRYFIVQHGGKLRYENPLKVDIQATLATLDKVGVLAK